MVKEKKKKSAFGGRQRTDSSQEFVGIHIHNSCLDYTTKFVKSQGVKLKWMHLFWK